MAYFTGGRLFPFNTPWDLLNFSPISLPARLRMGLAALRLQMVTDYAKYEDVRAADVLPDLSGREAFNAVWRPLLEAKFGAHWRSISMAWFWSRVHVRARSRPRGSLREMLGYIDGSFLELTRALANSAELRGARINLGTPIEGIDRVRDRVRGVRVGGQPRRADAVVATVGLPILRRLLPEHANWIRIPQIRYRGALVLLLQLEDQLSRYYWTNVADAAIPFPVLVEHTNLIGPERYGGARLLYAGSYLDPGHEYFEYSADQLLATYAPAIKRVFPGFAARQVKDLWLSADRVAPAGDHRWLSAPAPAVRDRPRRALYLQHVADLPLKTAAPTTTFGSPRRAPARSPRPCNDRAARRRSEPPPGSAAQQQVVYERYRPADQEPDDVESQKRAGD